MKKAWLIILIFALICSACSSRKIEDDTSFVDNPDSELIPLLLNRNDFNEKWKLSYGEVRQHLGGIEDVNADEYASYYLVVRYLPLNTYVTLVHEIYLGNSSKVNPDVFSFEDLLPWSEFELSQQQVQCYTYPEKSRKLCMFIENREDLMSALMFDAASRIPDNEIIQAMSPIITAIETRIQEYTTR
jgi:hypothetical protein